MKRFRKENCTSKVRKQFITFTGEKISLIGTHAYEWGVVRERKNISMMIFNNRAAAVKLFNQLYKELKIKKS